MVTLKTNLGDITLDSDAIVMNPIPVFDPNVPIPLQGDPSLLLIPSEYDRAEDASDDFVDAFDGLGNFLAPYLLDASLLGNSFVHAGGGTPAGDLAIAGAVNVLDVYNQAGSGIFAGAVK